MGKKARSSKPRGGTRDSVTGLSVDIPAWGGVLRSDTVYDVTALEQSRLGKAISKKEIEAELGNEAIIITVAGGDLLEDPTIPHWETRYVYLGSFTYDSGGRLSRAEIREVSMISEVAENPEWGIGHILKGNGVIDFRDGNSGAAWQSKAIEIFSLYTDSSGTNEDPKDSFYNYEISKYYPSGWTSNPFSPNLI
jgi:hypothetical protein